MIRMNKLLFSLMLGLPLCALPVPGQTQLVFGPGPEGPGNALDAIVAVVDDVDAADEGHLAIDRTQLLVQAAHLSGLQPAPPAMHGPEYRQRDAVAIVAGHA